MVEPNSEEGAVQDDSAFAFLVHYPATAVSFRSKMGVLEIVFDGWSFNA